MFSRWLYHGLGLCAAVFIALDTAAHDSPGDVIHALTHRMEASGPTARLLAARAFEYQYLGQWDEAIADFEAALERQPRYGAAIDGLAQVLLRQEQFELAIAVANRGLQLETTPEREGPYHAIVARARGGQSRWQQALEAWRAALRSDQPDVDWFLEEARCLAELHRYNERAHALGEAKERNPSIVLEQAWIHALVDARQYERALPEMNRFLDQARWKSTWLLLRARLHAHTGNESERRTDAEQALAEINQRWSWDDAKRDPMLLLQAGLAFALLDQPQQARAHLDAARRHGVSSGQLANYESAVGAIATSGR